MSVQESSMPKELLEAVEKALTTENKASVLRYVINNPKCAYRDLRVAFPKIGAATIAGAIVDFVDLDIFSKENWKVRDVPEEERQKLKDLGYSSKAPYVAYQPFELSSKFAQYKSSLLNLIQEKTELLSKQHIDRSTDHDGLQPYYVTPDGRKVSAETGPSSSLSPDFVTPNDVLNMEKRSKEARKSRQEKNK